MIHRRDAASILWKNASKAPEAANALGLTAQRLKECNLVDVIVREPLGGAHRDHDLVARNLKESLEKSLSELEGLSIDELLERRHQKIMKFGNFNGA